MCEMCKIGKTCETCETDDMCEAGSLGLLTVACDHHRNSEKGERGETGQMGEAIDWISAADAAAVLGVHRNTVVISLTDPARRAEWWGAIEGEHWRFKPLAERKIFQVDRQRAEDIAAGRWPVRDGSA